MNKYRNIFVIVKSAKLYIDGYIGEAGFFTCSFISLTFNPLAWTDLSRAIFLALVSFAINKTLQNGK